MGEALGTYAKERGIKLAAGDVGARLAQAASAVQVAPKSKPAAFQAFMFFDQVERSAHNGEGEVKAATERRADIWT